MLGMVVRGLIAASIGTVLLSSSAFAASDNLWRKDQDFTVTTSDSVEYPTKQYWMAGCSLTWSPVMQKDGTTKREKICAFRGNNLSMGRYVDSTNHTYYVIKIGADSVYRQLSGIDGASGRVFLRPDDDTLIVQFPGAQTVTSPRFRVFKLSDNAFLPEMSGVGFTVWRYAFDNSKATTFMGFVTPSGATQYPTMDGYVFSKNREYVLALLKDDSLIVANTKTGETRSIAVSLASGASDSAVSDDGKYAVLGMAGQLFYTENCGRPYDYETYRLGHNQFRANTGKACEMTYLKSEASELNEIGPAGAIFYFSDDNTTLSFDYPRETPRLHTVIQTEAYKPNQLDYLALGDSYSSGEGDIELMSDGTNYYTLVTDTDGGCHLSTRSYPFLLRDAWGINDDKMQSVACSGAKIVPDYNSLLSSYTGQGGRLSSLSEERRTELQDRALDVFIPGYAPQLEFAKKYQPKVITLTGGGNDVGFAKILEYCASDVLESTQAYSCEYVEGGVLHDILWDSIHSIKSRAIELVRQIKVLSPNSEINIIGYPSFIAGSESVCALNSSTINGPERDMINDAVSELNRVLMAVADEVEVAYIDIENSLVGGRLCEGSEYVTGLWDADGYRKKENRGVTFHPNAAGHNEMASAISQNISGNIQDYSEYQLTIDEPIIPTFHDNFTSDHAYEGENISIVTDAYTYAPVTVVTVTAYSLPTVLGTVTTEIDGSINANIGLEDLSSGKHLLVLRGTSYSGEQVAYYQFITVGATQNDIDGDGVDDSLDNCSFIQSWIDEQSGEDVCAEKADSDDASSVPGSSTFAPYQIGNDGSVQTSSVYIQQAQSRLANESVVDVNQTPTEEVAVLGDSVTSNTDKIRSASSELSGTFWLWGIMISSISAGGVIIYARAKIYKNK